MPPTVKKVLQWLFWGFILYAIITSPDHAADIVRSVWTIVSTAFLNIVRFFNALLG